MSMTTTIGLIWGWLLLPIALDFLSQYDSIDSIDQLFNTMPIEQYSPYCSGLDTHCMVGLISAKLSNNADYENVKRMYQRIVKKRRFHKRDEIFFFTSCCLS